MIKVLQSAAENLLCGSRKVRTIAGITVMLAFSMAIAQQETPAGHDWSYSGELGPPRWGDLKADYATCKLGQLQSPIDIRNARKAPLPPITFDYKPSALKIIKTGHTIQVNYDPGSFISVGNKRYELRQFHFHHPSEERIEGKAYEMAVHLVHADPEGHLAVVAVLLRAGGTNPTIQKLWEYLPSNEGIEKSIVGMRANAGNLLPQSLGYYTFEGSLTTPPCSEGVTWFVLKNPREVSALQITTFAKVYPHNARPTQPLNGRMISESESLTAKIGTSE